MMPATRELQPCPFCKRTVAVPYREDAISCIGQCPYCHRVNAWFRPIEPDAVSGVVLNPEKLPARKT